MTKVTELARRVLALSPADQLRVAAGLIEEGCADLARPVIDRVREGLELDALVLSKCPGYKRSDYGAKPTCKYCGLPESEHK